MARKKTSEDPTEPVDVSPFADSLEAPAFIDDVTTAPEVVDSEPAPLLPGGEDEQYVSITLPKSILYALINPEYEGSDLYRAEQLGLSVDGKLTELGARILKGTDVIALNHKINTAYRVAHNRAVGPSRIVRA